jgi:hypothetical protein
VRTLSLTVDQVNEAGRHLGQSRPGDDPIDAMPKAWRPRFVQKIVNVGEPRSGAFEIFDPFEVDSTKLALVVFDAAGQPARTALVQRGELQVLM